MTKIEGENRVAVVTGAASGLGAAYAVRLAELGFDVAVCDLVEAGETVAAVEAAGRRGLAVRADVADPDAVEAFAAAVEAELGPAAVLVNNAGYSPFDRFEEITLEEWRRTIAVNLDGLFLVTRAFLPAMRAAGWGRVVNVTSAVCWDAERREVVHYAASKLGVVGFSRALAGEVGADGVTVNCICPGIVQTPLLEERIPAEQWQRYLERQAIKRHAVPEDLLAALTMLVGEGSGFVTGTVLPVHGGRVVI